LGLAPFAGIAFLWFIGVVRDRIGSLEDLFFSSVFFGSGLLYLAMMFASAALAGSLLSTYAIIPAQLVDSGIYTFGRAIMWRIANVYAIRMAGVFMISLGTIWVRTHTMPRWLVFLTYGLALVRLVSISYSLWVTLIFPGWVLIISVYILALNLRSEGTEDGLAITLEQKASALSTATIWEDALPAFHLLTRPTCLRLVLPGQYHTTTQCLTWRVLDDSR
jgi:hypothetical protein